MEKEHLVYTKRLIKEGVLCQVWKVTQPNKPNEWTCVKEFIQSPKTWKQPRPRTRGLSEETQQRHLSDNGEDSII